jgi:hypothetical protein
MADAMLMELLKEVRWKTLKILEGVGEEEARFTGGPGLKNSILWHAGHALVVVEHLGFSADGSAPKGYPAEWFEKFNWASQPALVTHWPTLAEVVEQLKNQRTRLAAHLETLSATDLAKVVGPPPRSRTLGGMILHGLHDEAGHQGEMYLLRKLWKARG